MADIQKRVAYRKTYGIAISCSTECVRRTASQIILEAERTLAQTDKIIPHYKRLVLEFISSEEGRMVLESIQA